jgi:hypothetical protein
MYEMANMATTWVEVQWTFIVKFNVTHNERQTITILKDIKKKIWVMEDYNDKFLQLCVIMSNWLDNILLTWNILWKAHTKWRLEILGMPKITIIELPI